MSKRRMWLGLVLLAVLVVAVGSDAGGGAGEAQAEELVPYGIEDIGVGCWPLEKGGARKRVAVAGQVFSDMLGNEQENRVEGVWVDGTFTADCTKKVSTGGAYSNEWGLAELSSSLTYRIGCTVHWDITSIVSPPGYVYDPDLSVGESAQVTCR